MNRVKPPSRDSRGAGSGEARAALSGERGVALGAERRESCSGSGAPGAGLLVEVEVPIKPSRTFQENDVSFTCCHFERLQPHAVCHSANQIK